MPSTFNASKRNPRTSLNKSLVLVILLSSILILSYLLVKEPQTEEMSLLQLQVGGEKVLPTIKCIC